MSQRHERAVRYRRSNLHLRSTTVVDGDSGVKTTQILEDFESTVVPSGDCVMVTQWAPLSRPFVVPADHGRSHLSWGTQQRWLTYCEKHPQRSFRGGECAEEATAVFRDKLLELGVAGNCSYGFTERSHALWDLDGPRPRLLGTAWSYATNVAVFCPRTAQVAVKRFDGAESPEDLARAMVFALKGQDSSLMFGSLSDPVVFSKRAWSSVCDMLKKMFEAGISTAPGVLYASRVGNQIAASHVSIFKRASYGKPVTNDGFASSREVLVDQGVLTSYLGTVEDSWRFGVPTCGDATINEYGCMDAVEASGIEVRIGRRSALPPRSQLVFDVTPLVPDPQTLTCDVQLSFTTDGGDRRQMVKLDMLALLNCAYELSGGQVLVGRARDWVV